MKNYYEDYDPEMDTHYEFPKRRKNKMFKKVVISILLVLFILATTFYIVYAKADTCVIHKGKEIWVNYHALKAHLNHGDSKCSNSSSSNGNNFGLSLFTKKVKVVDASYKDEILFLTWKGFTTTSFRICFTENNKQFCTEKEKPLQFIATKDGYIGYINIKLEHKKYKIFASGSKTDDGFILDLR